MIEVTGKIISEVVDKFLFIEKEIAQEKGGFVLFALFEPEDAQGKWDVIISAPWIGDKKKEALNYITSKISSKLSWQEQVLLSRILLLDPSDDLVNHIHTMVEVEHGNNIRFTNSIFNGVHVKDAFIITSKRHAALPERANPNRKKIGRNDSCPCGSGKKYKKCHGA
jgi:hypothetical protein